MGMAEVPASVPVEGAIGKSSKQNGPRSSGSIQVNSRQKGNPLLKHLRAVPWQFAEDVGPDYLINSSCVVLYLSVRYHTLNPAYIGVRLDALGQGHKLRVLLVHVDVKEPHHVLKQLMRLAILSELTLMLAWSHEEAAKVIETYKTFEHKPPDMIMEKGGTEPHEKMIEALTSVKSVNKTDAVTLLGTFRTLEALIRASPEDLALCPGFGPNKAKKLHKVLHEPFLRAEKTAVTTVEPAEEDEEES